MSHILEIEWLDACRFESVYGPKLLVQAIGEAPSSDWSDIRLSPRFYSTPAGTGLLEFDFKGRAPCGRVVDCAVKVSASIVVGLPPWCGGVKAYAATNSAICATIRSADEVGAKGEVALAYPVAPPAPVLPLAVYEDHFDSVRSWSRRCLRHELALSIEGPDEGRVRQSLAEVAASSLAAKVSCAYPQAGEALSLAIGSLSAWMTQDLGNAYSIRIEDRARWADSVDGRWPADFA